METTAAEKISSSVSRGPTIHSWGVNSPARAFGAVGGGPRFLSGVKDHTSGILMGMSKCDYVCSWGPLILGHAHPRVVQAVSATCADGTSFRDAHPSRDQIGQNSGNGALCGEGAYGKFGHRGYHVLNPIGEGFYGT